MDELRETCCSNGSVDTPAKPVNVFADEPDSREVASVIDLDHATLTRLVCDALSKKGEAGGHAAPCGGADPAAAEDGGPCCWPTPWPLLTAIEALHSSHHEECSATNSAAPWTECRSRGASSLQSANYSY